MSGLLLPKPTRTLPAERHRIATVSKRPSARDRAIADRLCAAIVKTRALNRCEASGLVVEYPYYAAGEMVVITIQRCSRGLDWAHGWGRGIFTLRWAHANSFALCRNHHIAFEAHKAQWREVRRAILGAELYDRMEVLAKQPGRFKVDMAWVLAELRAGRTQAERVA